MRGWVLGAACAAACAGADALPPPTGPAVPPGAKLEKLFTRPGPLATGLTEGPAAAPDGRIFFSDIPVDGDDKGKIMVFDPKTMTTAVFAEDSRKSNGLKFDAAGRLVACEGADNGGRCVSRYDITTGKREVLADRYMGKRFNAPNDLALDAKGRVYFSDPKYVGTETRELEHRAVYRIDADGTVVEVTHDVSKPNGVALSPDGKTLYVAENDNGTDRIDPSSPPPTPGPMRLYAFPLGPDGLVSGPRKTLLDFGKESGIDGMAVDAQGRLYLAVRSLMRPGVMVVTPAGEEVGFIPTGPSQPGAKKPVGLPSNVCFGRGDDAGTLYVTVDLGLYRVRLK